jgi:sulfonate transport system substrate-binding protein
MIRRRHLSALTGLLLSAATAHAADPKVVHITYVTAPFNVPSIVMRANGYLDEAFAARGITVESPIITSGAQQIQAIAAGAIDIASVLGDSSAILARANGVDLKVVAAFSRSPKAFDIIGAKGGPSSIEALKGKTVAGPKGTTLNHLLAAALASKGLKLADVNYINMDLPAARAALVSGQVDAATLAGNQALAALAGGGRIITTGEGLIAPISVIAVAGPFLRDHRDLVDIYLAAHRRALAFIAANPEKALAIAADEQKLSLADARAMLPLYDFSPDIIDQDVKNLQASQEFMIQAGMLQHGIDVGADLIDPGAFGAK